jgi:hypothetical protein
VQPSQVRLFAPEENKQILHLPMETHLNTTLSNTTFMATSQTKTWIGRCHMFVQVDDMLMRID